MPRLLWVGRSKGLRKEQKPACTTIRRLKSGEGDRDAEAKKKKTRKGASTSTRKIESEAVVELEAGLPRFGPTYGDDEDPIKIAKDQAWQHIKDSSSGDVTSYLRSIALIEKEAMEIYDSTIVDKLKRAPHEFRRMMARDGCFFLQLALHILGAGVHLCYFENHPYFGKESGSGSRSSWIPAMFFPGNQVPCVVLNALMKQAFFQEVIKKHKWERPSEDNLAMLVLYQTVVEPHLTKKRGKPPNPPSDVLQALHNLLLGSRDNDPIYAEMKDFHDLEAAQDNTRMKIPSAGELYKKGIKLRKGEGGITNIRFKNRVYCAFLYLPPLTIDSHTEHLLTSLANYELNLNESARELTAYLRFMRDLCPTYKDFKILQRKGIIQVKDENLKRSMLKMLDEKLVSSYKPKFTLNFRQIRRKIKDYGGPPWRFITFILFVFTVVQTIFSVLSYCIPPRN